ncbi:MAG: universal stress protein [Bacteroidetes bacterium]|nr:MAG: universal stress protein [Bacteroidota bacterium]
MSEIVVAIDFSSCSVNATRTAVIFANAFDANITLVHVCKPCSDESVYPDTQDIHYKEAEKRLKDMISDFGPLMKKEMRFRIRKGKVYSEIVNEAKYNDAVMLIAGTHGISGFEEYFIGSNAYRLVSLSPSPMVSIRTMFQKREIKKILFPIDSSRDTRQKTNFAAEVAQKLNAEVRVLGVYDTGIKEIRKKIKNYTHQVMKYFEKNGIKSSIDYAEGKKASGIILDYINIHDFDMVVMMSDKDSSTMIIGNEAQRVINHSPVPVLSIHPKETSSSSISLSGSG